METQLLLSGDLYYVNQENLKALKDGTEEVESLHQIFSEIITWDKWTDRTPPKTGRFCSFPRLRGLYGFCYSCIISAGLYIYSIVMVHKKIIFVLLLLGFLSLRVYNIVNRINSPKQDRFEIIYKCIFDQCTVSEFSVQAGPQPLGTRFHNS